eukprot:gene18992-24808_t
MREWKGIRYGQSPEGDLRWEASIPPEESNEVYIANYNAPSCPQTCNLPPGNCPPFGTSEDCLFLTVMAPLESPSIDNGYPDGYPVFFWIHGGAFEQGCGALGFLASESMIGNYGFLDQRLALQWTNDNIQSFGGNPNKITIGGQSAGAMSVSCHVASPGSIGLFQSTIMESNPLGLPYHTRETASKNAKSVFDYLNCAYEDIDCIKSKSIDDILQAQNNAIKLNPSTLFINFLPFAPLIDTDGEIPVQPLYALQQGDLFIQPDAMLAGSVYDEGQLFVYELFGSQLTKEYYPYDLIPNNNDGRNVLNVLATDLLFYCPLRNITRGYQSVLGEEAIPTFIYRFKHVISFDCWGANYTYCDGVVCHGSELPFVFNVFTDGDTVTYDPNDDEISLTNDLVNIWNNFITNNDPNKGLSVPSYLPLYNTLTDELVVLDEPGSEDQSFVRSSYCDLWDKIGYFW